MYNPNKNILQWNINGLRSKITQLQCLMTEYQPNIIALQETKLPPNINYNMKKFHIYNKSRNADGGGVALYISKELPVTSIELNTDLEAVAATVHYENSKLTYCSLYLPPGVDFPVANFCDLLEKLPSPFLILGDFNSKNTCWGSPISANHDLSYRRGTQLLDILETKTLHILNTGNPTFFRAYNNYFSHIDLSIGSPEFCSNFNWDTHWNTYDSDHFPIIVSHSLNNLYLQKPIKWNFEKTSISNWNDFSNSINLPEINNPTNATQINQQIIDHILEVAEQHIKQTSPNINSKYFNPWWNENCAKAIKEKRKRLRILKRNSTSENLIAYNKASAKSRWTIKNAKKVSWCNFVTSINQFTPLKTIWNKIRKIDNKTYNPQKVVLKINDSYIPEPEEVSSTLGNFFSSISSNNNYSAEFQNFKNMQESQPIFFEEANNLIYNRPFTIEEFKAVLEPSKNSSPGEDGIPYEIYKHLPLKDQIKLVQFFNYIWKNNDFPEQWRNAHVIPLLKPFKPSHDPNSYRPISLTISLCKLMEKMIAKRLMSYLIENNTIVDHQFGFQKSKSTLDPLIQLEYAIRDTIMLDEFLVVVFLDLEKAYDMVWAYGLLQELVEIGLKGNLPIFVYNFLNNRTIQVKINNFISEKFKLENGLPQGSILSVFLFLIAINKLFKNCDKTVNKLFCDDGMFWCQNKDLAHAEQQIQDTLNHLTNWSLTNGLKFSIQKSCYCIFTHKNTRDLNLTLSNQILPRNTQVRYLGVIFDQRLSWKPHINHLREKCFNRLNILKAVAHKKWGSDRKTLRMLYLSLIQSQLNYASFLFNSAHHRTLAILDRVQYAGIRIIIGAMRVTRTSMLEAESVLMPLKFRREFLGLTYLGRTARLESSITAKILSNHFNFEFYAHRNKPFSWIAQAQILLDEMNINYGEIAQINPKFLYYTPKTKIKFTMHTKRKEEFTEIEARASFEEMLSQYPNFFSVYTDGSVMNERSGCAVVIKYISVHISYKYRLPNNTNIFIAELLAISKAIDRINETDGQIFLICSDSLSALQAIKGGTPNFLVHQILGKLNDTTKEICFEWTPSHVNIPGNSRADEMAKNSLDLEEIEPLPLDYSDFRIKVKNHIKISWQRHWDQINEYPNETKLYRIKPVLKDWSSSHRKNRQEEIMLARLRLNNCQFNKGHIIPRLPCPTCQLCQTELSTEHLLVNCPRYAEARRPIIAYLNKEGLPISYEYVLNDFFPHNLIFDFIKEIGYLDKI